MRVVREYLGLTVEAFADHLRVDERTVRRWEAGRQPVPQAVAERVEALEASTARAVGRLVNALNSARDPAVVVYRRDEDFREAHSPEAQFTAAYHRAIVARACEEVPGVQIRYHDDLSGGAVRLTPEQVELARITVGADRAVGRSPDPLLSQIADIGDEPITVHSGDVDRFLRRMNDPGVHNQ